jgi:hypothetical protein
MAKPPYCPFVTHNNSFDAEEALIFVPKVARNVLKNNFGTYNNREFESLYHHVIAMVSHEVTDALCVKYPEESYHKLSRWSDSFAYRVVKQHYEERKKKNFHTVPQ